MFKVHERYLYSDEKMIKDPRRLYAPGRLYHIVERKPFRLGRIPPVVRTAVPVDGRFEHIVLSCNATSDHCNHLDRERSPEGYGLKDDEILDFPAPPSSSPEIMVEKDHIMEIPAKQRMERQETLAREHSEEYRAALQRAVTLSVPMPIHLPSMELSMRWKKERIRIDLAGNLLLVLRRQAR
ncbi:hypothetical protein NC652_030314 [Populus alba x Populus x berolinensis]|nr:hypothetical protein NC652_030314 [Populus alba x Populus x berolinensis]